MTQHTGYHRDMLILSVQGLGALYVFCSLLICIIVVCGCKLAKVGLRTLGKKLPPEAPPKEEKTPEAVYYLVERKKKRVKTEYSDPKRIQFK